ncbi:MAG: hypothetical protein KDD90_06915 [Sphingomonadaceae bacterium]|nr:hypothetical protein [Sphingomonadaceae bacterium]
MVRLLALLALPLAACSAKGEDSCVDQIEFLMQERDNYVATQMEALKALSRAADAGDSSTPPLEVTQAFSEFMAQLDGMNNRIAVEVHDCPAAAKTALAASRNAAPPTIKMEPAE